MNTTNTKTMKLKKYIKLAANRHCSDLSGSVLVDALEKMNKHIERLESIGGIGTITARTIAESDRSKILDTLLAQNRENTH